LNGQWIGPYTSANNGTLVVELDDAGATYEGELVAYGNNVTIPASAGSPAVVRVPPVLGRISISKSADNWSGTIPLSVVERGTGRILSAGEVATMFPGVSTPTSATTTLRLNGETMDIAWTTDQPMAGTAQIHRSAGTAASELEPLAEVTSWEQFKGWASRLEPDRFLFRGQSVRRKLRTAFHRHGRASLIRFMERDVPALHRDLSGLTTHRFNLNDALDYAAFLALAQHHGYPTPLLDWTKSPFIAAYFAFRGLERDRITDDQRVRILIFDERYWGSSFERAAALFPAFLHITVLAPLAINNPRALPQQSLSMVTNIDDIEAYVRRREAERGVSILRAIELPASERTRVLTELNLMGINPGSMFPGLDGACAQLKDRFFGV
jgi:FRG domain